MKQVICVQAPSGITPSTSVANHTAITQGDWSAFISTSQGPIATDGVINNLIVTVSAAPGTAKSWTFTLVKNNVDTAIVVTISGSATTGRDTTNAVAVSPGDVLRLRATPSGTPASATTMHAFDFTSTNAAESFYIVVAGSNASVSSVQRIGAFYDRQWTAGAGSTQQAIVAAAGNVTACYMTANLAPGAGKSYTLVLYKNGVKQDGSGVTVNTQVSISGASATSANSTFTLPVSPGDTLYMECTPSGTPTATAVCFGLRFAATTDGESQAGGYWTNNPFTGGITNYNGVLGFTNEGGGGSSAEALMATLAGVTPFTYRGLYAALTGSPGSGKSYVFDLRRNKTSPSGTPTVTVSNLNTSAGTASGSVSYVDGDTADIEYFGTGTPTSRQGQWATVQFVPPDITSSGALTIDRPSPSGSGWATVVGSGGVIIDRASIQGSGTETIHVGGGVTVGPPSPSGSGWATVVGTGQITAKPPTITAQDAFGPLRITQQGRYVVTAEDAPKGRLTQFGRYAVTAEGDPAIRLTQMGRQVLYRFTCEHVTPTPPIDIPVRVLASQLIPRWLLERYDIKPRFEDRTAGSPTGRTFTPTWQSDGARWKLNRMDISASTQGRHIGPNATVSAPDAGVAAWRLERFDMGWRTEERA